ncbi:hypothetical protein N825_05140 [Skermanella stibiiresistens SB22]|uniref:Uncharacterized protein n=1 Tax=Skermanella stibiiresistens SB22 TaxID=1385369 RepID=W9GTB5_9PROT|nr:hypothetical protein N825_05140 [Skermanella stibiiresistens SB22]
MPQELVTYPDGEDYWVGLADNDLTANDPFDDHEMRRGNLLLSWIMISTVMPASDVAKRAWKLLQHRQLARTGRLLADAVRKANGDGPRIAAALFAELQNPKAEQVCLLRYDPATRRDELLSFPY